MLKNPTKLKQIILLRYSSNQHQGMQWRYGQWNSHVYLIIQGRNYYPSQETDLVDDVSTP